MIGHIDADSFFASVIVRQNPRLQGKPLLATGMGGGCVIAASYEAKAKGVHTGMRLSDAIKLVPEAVRLPSDFHEAGLASEQIENILLDACPVIEQMSIDEWYLDLGSIVGGEPADPSHWALRIQKQVKDQTGLSVSVGVGPTKLIAKMAGEYRKPGGVTVVEVAPQISPTPTPPPWGRGFCVPFPRLPAVVVAQAGGGRARDGGSHAALSIRLQPFLRDRPAPAIPGIGRKRQIHTDAQGWKTAWDIATAQTDMLLTLFGKQGREMQLELLGTPLFPVRRSTDPPKSISRTRSFRREENPRILWAHLLRHAEYTVLKMRRHRLAVSGISVWLRDDQYRHDSSHCSLPQPMTTEQALQPYLQKCLRRLYQTRIGYTQVGLALWRLSPKAPHQFSLFEDPRRVCRDEELQECLDGIHEEFGRNAITRGAALPIKTGTVRKMELGVYE